MDNIEVALAKVHKAILETAEKIGPQHKKHVEGLLAPEPVQAETEQPK